MSGLSEFQSVFRVAKSSTNRQDSQSLKRNRLPLSCTACRARKSKCDRQEPCTACIKRGDQSICTFSRGTKAQASVGPVDRPSEAQSQLRRLEGLIEDLIQSKDLPPNHVSKEWQQAQSDLPTPSVSVDSRLQEKESPNGHVAEPQDEQPYQGATHWETILENVRDIQGVLRSEHIRPSEEQTHHKAPSFDPIIDTSQSLTLADVRDLLPSRSTADKLLRLFFSAKITQIPFIHHQKFQREYDEFWKDHSSKSFLWISIFLSAMHIGARVDELGHQELFGSSDSPSPESWLINAGRALVTGNYRRIRPNAVEALLIYTICKYMTKYDSDACAWTLMSVAVRLAIRMGYHRDPSMLKNLTPFQGEMRRRTFLVIENFDLLLSSQAGLPPVLHGDECDTASPSNLHDFEFDEDSERLPHSRLPTDPTPMLYYCAKNQFVKVFRRIMRHVTPSQRAPYEETMRLDREVREIHDNLPPNLHMIPITTLTYEEAYEVLHRLNIDLLFLKSLCILHRTYLTYDRTNPMFEFSREACIHSALQILQHQIDLRVACAPGGKFHDNKWMLGSLASHDFLLAAMITSLDLVETHNSNTVSKEANGNQLKKYDMLTMSYHIWTYRMPFSQDARRASKILSIMLTKVPRPQVSRSEQVHLRNKIEWRGVSEGGLDASQEQNWSKRSLDGFDENDMTKLDALMSEHSTGDVDPEDPFGMIFQNIDDLDWGLLDQSLLDPEHTGGNALNWQ